jgi:hypothetical protein
VRGLNKRIEDAMQAIGGGRVTIVEEHLAPAMLRGRDSYAEKLLSSLHGFGNHCAS